jgi:hypothetical protein
MCMGWTIQKFPFAVGQGLIRQRILGGSCPTQMSNYSYHFRFLRTRWCPCPWPNPCLYPAIIIVVGFSSASDTLTMSASSAIPRIHNSKTPKTFISTMKEEITASLESRMVMVLRSKGLGSLKLVTKITVRGITPRLKHRVDLCRIDGGAYSYCYQIFHASHGHISLGACTNRRAFSLISCPTLAALGRF